MKRILAVLFIVLAASFVLSVWSQVMFDNTIESHLGTVAHLNEAMKYKELLFYVMIVGAMTVPLIVYFSFDDFRWARHLTASSVLAVFLAFEHLWNIFCCYA